jgi:hypothetical protein
MPTEPPDSNANEQTNQLIEQLLPPNAQPVNADFQQRAEQMGAAAKWQPTQITGINIRVLEYIHGHTARLTALLRLDLDTRFAALPSSGLEVLLINGVIADNENVSHQHTYIRYPLEKPDHSQPWNQSLIMSHGHKLNENNNTPLEFYLAVGQFETNDDRRRVITLDEDNEWFPGPVDGTEVFPLHMHNGNNSMLVRWTDKVSFQPKLDPLGEEVLVLEGVLKDARGVYETGSWVRNPVESWQAWTGEVGTIIYYKNGHLGGRSSIHTEHDPTLNDKNLNDKS